MKRFINQKLLFIFVLMLSLTSVDANAQRNRKNSRSTITIINWLVWSPEGYSNLRTSPGGRIIGKVYNDEIVWLNANAHLNAGINWLKVYTSSGKFRGYIHRSQINWLTWGTDGPYNDDHQERRVRAH